jgi:two-component system, cell cycle response regulator
VGAVASKGYRLLWSDPVLRLVLLLGVGWVAGYALATGLVAGDKRAQMLLGDIVFLIPIIAAAGLALLAGVRLAGRARLFWLIIGGSLLLLLLGESTWSYYELALKIEAPSPSLADLGYLASYVAVLPAAVIGFGGASGERRARAWLDAAVVTIGLGALGWRLLISAKFSNGLTAEAAIEIAYPLLTVAVLILLVSLGFSGHHDVPLSVGMAMLAYAVATVGDAAYSYLTTHELFVSGGWIDLTWQVQLVLLALAAVTAIRLQDKDPSVALYRRDFGLWLIFGGIAAAMATATVDFGVSLALVVVMIAVVGLVVRHQLTVRDFHKIGQALDRALGEQERLAATDELTSLHNRRYLLDAIKSELSSNANPIRPVGLLLLDLDRFKAINDAYGHDGGDVVLAEVAVRLSRCVRQGDVVARYGGEEFVVFLRDADAAVVALVGERCRADVEAAPITLPDGTEISVTTSVGGVSGTTQSEHDRLIRQADEAMYAAKRSGRNRLIMAGQPDEPAI